MKWLQSPYWTRPEPVYLDIPQGPGRPLAEHEPTAETSMTEVVREHLGHKEGFINVAAGSGALTVEQFVQSYIDYAKLLTESPYAKYTCANFDAEARGNYWAGFVIDTLKQIQYGGPDASESVYDIWTRIAKG